MFTNERSNDYDYDAVILIIFIVIVLNTYGAVLRMVIGSRAGPRHFLPFSV